MRRYKKFKKGKGYLAKFTSWSDIQSGTSANTVVQFRVGGSDIKRRLGSMFGAFKYYKIVGSKITCIPASTLPGDPAQLSYNAGDPAIDFRDQLNVGLVRFTNGEPVPYMDKLMSTDASTARKAYYALMMDGRWSKFSLQKGFKRFTKPCLYDDGLNVKYPLPNATTEVWGGDGTYGQYFNTGLMQGSNADHSEKVIGLSSAQHTVFANAFGDFAIHRFQSGKKTRLGWLPTDDVIINGTGDLIKGMAIVPDIPTMTFVLPINYKTTYAFRIVETTYVRFAGLKYENVGESDGSDGYLADSGIYGLPSATPGVNLPGPRLGDGSQ